MKKLKNAIGMILFILLVFITFVIYLFATPDQMSGEWDKSHYEEAK